MGLIGLRLGGLGAEGLWCRDSDLSLRREEDSSALGEGLCLELGQVQGFGGRGDPKYLWLWSWMWWLTQ